MITKDEILRFQQLILESLTKEELSKIDDLESLVEIKQELIKLMNNMNFNSIWNRIVELKIEVKNEIT